MRELKRINLTEEFLSEGRVRFEKSEYPFIEYSGADGLSYPISSKSDIELKISNVKKGQILLEGSFKITLLMPCDRCLKDVEVPIDLEFQKEFLDEEHQGSMDDKDEFYALEGSDLNVYDLIDQEILLNLPSKILCSDECKGICPICGTDRNLNECNCDSFVPDPRMAGIMDIFMANKEV